MLDDVSVYALFSSSTILAGCDKVKIIGEHLSPPKLCTLLTPPTHTYHRKVGSLDHARVKNMGAAARAVISAVQATQLTGRLPCVRGAELKTIA
ncbi:uncharacterized protein N7473_009410 [Penicillium subrubescens]|uniref:uncharacterized protein n=1 Tax=Penicillium subrubescens TaxID=1316194 RepID=UPI002545094C|nr:uncharacterized protein N7473_009410 [Penicillium subrubescens]KAJ5886736.1 hypothetical protein N7473_009410 [Penicillium subrubescens]